MPSVPESPGPCFYAGIAGRTCVWPSCGCPPCAVPAPPPPLSWWEALQAARQHSAAVVTMDPMTPCGRCGDPLRVHLLVTAASLPEARHVGLTLAVCPSTLFAPPAPLVRRGLPTGCADEVRAYRRTPRGRV